MNSRLARNVHRSLRALAVAAALSGAAAFAQPIVRIVEPAHRPFAYTSTQVASAEAFHEADLGAKVSGYVSELAVDVGSQVREGQVLARIAVPELVEARNAAAADVAARRSEYERTQMLAERNSITQRALAEAQNRLDSAIAREAEAEAQMAYATIEAPFAGVVTARAIDPGDMVFEASSPKGSAEPLLRVARLDLIRVKTYVPEREAVWADVGDAATVTLDALPGRTFAGTIARMSGAIDPATRTMLAEIDLPNDDGRIRPGFYGRARIVLENRERALALPSSAVRYDGAGGYVLAVAAGDVVQRTAIEIGIEVGGWVEVLAGLSGGERVIDGVVADVADGAAVRIATQ